MVGLRNVYVCIIEISTKEQEWFVLYRNSDIKRCEVRAWTFPGGKIHNQVDHILIVGGFRV